ALPDRPQHGGHPQRVHAARPDWCHAALLPQRSAVARRDHRAGTDPGPLFRLTSFPWLSSPDPAVLPESRRRLHHFSESKRRLSENPGARLVHNGCTTYTIPGKQPGGTVATARLGITGKIRVVAPGSCQAWAVENVKEESPALSALPGKGRQRLSSHRDPFSGNTPRRVAPNQTLSQAVAVAELSCTERRQPRCGFSSRSPLGKGRGSTHSFFPGARSLSLDAPRFFKTGRVRSRLRS